MQKPHHEAQNSTSTTDPLKSASDTGLPFISFNVKAGARYPTSGFSVSLNTTSLFLHVKLLADSKITRTIAGIINLKV